MTFAYCCPCCKAAYRVLQNNRGRWGRCARCQYLGRLFPTLPIPIPIVPKAHAPSTAPAVSWEENQNDFHSMPVIDTRFQNSLLPTTVRSPTRSSFNSNFVLAPGKWNGKAVVGVAFAVLGVWSLFAAVAAVVTNLAALSEFDSRSRQRGKMMAAFSALLSLALVCQSAIPACCRALSRVPSRDEVLMSEAQKQLVLSRNRLREFDRLYEDASAERERIAATWTPAFTAAQTVWERKVLADHLSHLNALLLRVQAAREELKSEALLLELSLNANRLLQRAPNRQDDERSKTVLELTGELRDRQRQRLP